MNRVIIIEHAQQFPDETNESKQILSVYNYYNHKSLRHVFQHYLDVAKERKNFASSSYGEGQKTFSVKTTNGTEIRGRVMERHCVTARPLAPFPPRSEVEAELLKNIHVY